MSCSMKNVKCKTNKDGLNGITESDSFAKVEFRESTQECQ